MSPKSTCRSMANTLSWSYRGTTTPLLLSSAHPYMNLESVTSFLPKLSNTAVADTSYNFTHLGTWNWQKTSQWDVQDWANRLSVQPLKLFGTISSSIASMSFFVKHVDRRFEKILSFWQLRNTFPEARHKACLPAPWKTVGNSPTLSVQFLGWSPQARLPFLRPRCRFKRNNSHVEHQRNDLESIFVHHLE